MADDQVKYVISIKDDGSASVESLSRSLKGLKGDISDTQKGAEGTGPSFLKMAGAFGVGQLAADAVVGALRFITDGLVNVGKQSIIIASDFQKGMGNVSTIVDMTKESMSDMGEKVKEIAGRIPVDLNDLTAGLYDIRSAGISADDAMMVLENSGKLATAGLGTVKDAANIATSAINAYGLKGKDAEKAFNTLFAGVQVGKMTISELAMGFGQLAPIASTVGLTLEEMTAATAALTTTGQTASVAQNQLRAAINSLISPNKEMTELLASMGVESGKALLENVGLVDAMKMLDQAAGGNTESLAKAYGSVEALGAAMGLTGEQGKAYADALKLIEGDTNVLEEAFKKQSETLANTEQLFKNRLNIALMEVGNNLLPIITAAITAMLPLVDSLTTFIKTNLPVWIAKFKEVGEYLWNTWQPSISTAWESIKKDWKIVYDALAPALTKLFDEFFKLSGEVGVHQIGSFTSFIDVVARTIAIIGPPIVDVIRILLPILADMATAIYDLYIEFEKAIKWIQDFILTNETIKKWKEDVSEAIDGAIKWLNDLSLAWIKTKDAINNNPITQIINKVVQTVTKKEGGYVGFADGGFTSGGIDEIAGAVHGGEWVAPAWMVNAMPSLFGNLESARQGNTYNQPITVNANIQDNTDFRLLMNELAFNLRT